MRTEYTFIITDRKGKKDYNTYPKKYVMDNYLKAKAFYENRECTVELFKVQYNGAALYKATKIEAV